MENNQNRLKCDICNTFYSKKYMSRHLQSLKHIGNEYEYKLEEDIETQLIGNSESVDDEIKKSQNLNDQKSKF